jgi:acyl-CoA thioesterase-1
MKGHRPQSRSYGNRAAPVQRIAAVLVTIACLFAPALARAEPVKIVALGDSLTAGYGLPVADAFPTKLQAAQ